MQRRLICTLVLALIAATSTWGAERAPAEMTASDKDALALSAKIDELIAAKWKEKGIKPAATTDDAEFLRRVYLDLEGHVPRLLDVGNFLDNPSQEKRWQLIKKLIQEDRFATHFAAVWRAIILNQVNSQQFQAFFVVQFEQFLKQRIREGAGYDKIVREIVTAAPQGGYGASAFYQANENKPENLAASTSKLFLGVKIECAQCHKHPFAKWSQNQFWEFAGFFSGLQTGQTTGKPTALTIPGTDTQVEARFLDGKEPEWKNNVDRRVLLADWLTSADNPWFAREAVNRMWEYFFGVGLVEPVDDFNPDNPPSHPELLDLLTKEFATHKFDMKFLVRAIVMSKTYQLTSASSDASQDDPRMFARMAVRGMSAEQLYDSLAVTTTDKVPQPRYDNFAFGVVNDPRSDFLSRFPNQDRRSETKTSILQALYFMNGKMTADATSLASTSSNLHDIAEESNKPITVLIPCYSGVRVDLVDVGSFSPPIPAAVDHARHVRELYKIALGRNPMAAETERVAKYLASGGPTKDRKKALSDVLWALLNSPEFYFNH